MDPGMPEDQVTLTSISPVNLPSLSRRCDGLTVMLGEPYRGELQVVGNDPKISRHDAGLGNVTKFVFMMAEVL